MTSSLVPSSHSTLPGTAASRRIQSANTSGRIFGGLLKQQNTKPDSGKPQAVRDGGGPAGRRVVSLGKAMCGMYSGCSL